MKTVSAPGLPSCLFWVCIAHLLPRLAGLRRALRIAQHVPVPPGVAVSPDIVAETARRVALAGAFAPVRSRCLEQSLALLVLLRRRGVKAELRIGVQPRPFSAHAWVEVDGCPVNDSVEHTLRLQAFTPGGL